MEISIITQTPNESYRKGHQYVRLVVVAQVGFPVKVGVPERPFIVAKARTSRVRSPGTPEGLEFHETLLQCRLWEATGAGHLRRQTPCLH